MKKGLVSSILSRVFLFSLVLLHGRTFAAERLLLGQCIDIALKNQHSLEAAG